MNPEELGLIKNLVFVGVVFASVNVFAPLAVEWFKRVFFKEPVLGRRDYDGRGQTIFIDNESIKEWLSLYKRHIEVQERIVSIVTQNKATSDEIKEMVSDHCEQSKKMTGLLDQVHQKVVMAH